MDSTKSEESREIAYREEEVPDWCSALLDRQVDPDQLRRIIRSERGYSLSLLRWVHALQVRLAEIESSRCWRVRTRYKRLRTRLGKNASGKTRFAGLGRLFLPFTSRGRRFARHALKLVFRHLYLLLEENPVSIVPRGQIVATAVALDPYSEWRAQHAPRAADLIEYRDCAADLSYHPTISVLLPVFNPPLDFFEQALQSVVDQVYPHWELCIANDASTNPGVRSLIEGFTKRDERIKVVHRKENGHISAATNSALEIASGEFCAFMDHDDLLAPDALYHIALALNKNRNLDLLYSDEDKVDEAGRLYDPHFKPKWCPDNLLSRNYFGHLVVARTALVRTIGGLRTGYEGSQDHDMLLRATELSQRIHHVPRVLYHWRSHRLSTVQSMEAKPYALHAARAALQDTLQRREQPGTVEHQPGRPGFYSVRYTIIRPGKVSIVIPTRDQPSVLETCLRSIFERTDYANFEVIVIDNNSETAKTFELLDRYRNEHGERFRVLTRPIPFNFSRLMNEAVAVTDGDYLLLLNNDTEMIEADWLGALVEQAQRDVVGCVGAKLLYPHGTIQHAGVVLGLGGPACHVFAGAHRDATGYFNSIQSTSNYSAVTAACLMIRREVYERVGGFDEAFAVDFNDVDFCLRVREAGFQNVYLPHVCLFHHESLTRGHPYLTEESKALHERESKLLRERWQHYLEDDPCVSRYLALADGDLRIRL